MKAYKVTLFIFSVIAVLALLCVVFPADGVKAGNLTLRFPTLTEVLICSLPAAAAAGVELLITTSTVQMEYSYHVKDKKMIVKIAELCAAAKEKCADVEFVALDATRADEAFA